MILLLTTLLMAPVHAEVRYKALAIVETGNNDKAVGKRGEVSRYQILPHVWKVYSSSSSYRNPAIAKTVARRIMTERELLFKASTHRPLSDREFYLIWNAPLAFRKANYQYFSVKKLLRDRAERFSNVVESITKK